MKKILLLACACLLLHTAESASAYIHSPTYWEMVKSTAVLQINFISKGSGIDQESFNKIEEFLKAHPKKPSYTVNGFGKEGEKAINISLEGWSKKEQKDLEKEIDKLIVKKDLVLVKKLRKIRAKY